MPRFKDQEEVMFYIAVTTDIKLYHQAINDYLSQNNSENEPLEGLNDLIEIKKDCDDHNPPRLPFKLF